MIDRSVRVAEGEAEMRMSVVEAKAALRAWAVGADEEIMCRVSEARDQVKKFAPWAAGAAALFGVAAAVGKRGGGSGVRGKIGLARRGIGLVTSAIGIARVAAPIVSEVMGRRK